LLPVAEGLAVADAVAVEEELVVDLGEELLALVMLK